MRLRDLGIGVGRFVPGEGNAITDVPGVSVGRVEIGENGLCTGITAVVPYPAQVEKRRLFVGRWALDGDDGMTGLGVAEDFGTLSTPIVLAPAPAVGKLYDALIQYGLGRDSGLTTEAGWPPMVVGVDDGLWNPAKDLFERVGEEYLSQALQSADSGPVEEGSVGIGRGLCAFGMKGGVGTSSRLFEIDGRDYRVGVLVAANGGNIEELRVDGYPLATHLQVDIPDGELPGSFAAVVATDAPLLPRQLERLAGRTALGFGRVGLLETATRQGLVLAFSTSAIGEMKEGEVAEPVQMMGEEVSYELFTAAGEAGEEAVLNALLAAAPVADRNPVLHALSHDGWPQAVSRFQRERGR